VSDRRDFLKGMAAVGGAALMTNGCATTRQKRSSPMAEPPPVGEPAFRFAMMTDSHVYGRPPETWNLHREKMVEAFLREACAPGVDFVMHTGDFCTFGATPEVYRRVKGIYDRVCKDLGIPWYVVRGNHDTTVSDEEWRKLFGHGNYWFRHKSWAFVTLDRYDNGFERLPHYYDMSRETLEDLKGFLKDIPRSMPVVLNLHENPMGITSFFRGEEVLDLLAEHEVRLILFGHVQGNWVSDYRGIKHLTVTGDAQGFGSAPLSYAIGSCYANGQVATEIFPFLSGTPEAVTSLPATNPSLKVALRADWADLRGPKGTRRTLDTLPDEAPAPVWSQSFSGHFSVGAPTLKEGVLYVGTKTRGGFAECAVHAVDAFTGEVKWRRQVDGSVEGGILLAGDTGYFGTSSGSMFAIRLSDGAIRWSWNNGVNLPITCEPTLDGEVLHTAANWEAYALEAKTGKRIWRSLAVHSGMSYFTGGHSSPLVVGERVYHQRPYNGQPMTHEVQSLLKQNGQGRVLSDPEQGGWPNRRHGSPLLHHGIIYAPAKGLLALDPNDITRPLWWAEGPETSSTPAISGTIAVLPYLNALMAYDLEQKGARLWRVPFEPSLMHFVHARGMHRSDRFSIDNLASPVVDGEKVVIGDTAGQIRCLSLADGQERWRISVGEPMVGAPVFSGNTLFVTTYSGNLYAFATAS